MKNSIRNELVSIIIPAFNSEEYLQKCIDSVINQTYKNIEIIVVNDGSTDNTEIIAKSFDKVVVLNKDNGGLSSARKYGVEHASGDYIIFIDSDDYIEPDFVEQLYNYTTGKKDELVMCDFLKNGVKESDSYQFLEVSGKDNIFNLFFHKGIYNRTVNKLYPKEIIDPSFFPVGRDMLEDAFFTSHILEKCNKIVRIPYAGYNYIRHEGSISKSNLSPQKKAGMHSNILEKDIVLSRNVSKSEYSNLISTIYDHIKNALNANKSIVQFAIFDKIILLASFVLNNMEHCKSNNERKFFQMISKAKNDKDLFKKFGIFEIIYGSFKDKWLYIKSKIRKTIKNQ